MKITHRTPAIIDRAAQRAACITPRHIEHVRPDTPSEEAIGAAMLAEARAWSRPKTIVNPASQKSGMTDIQRRVYDVITEPCTSAQIARSTGLHRSKVQNAASNLWRKGLIECTEQCQVTHTKTWARVEGAAP